MSETSRPRRLFLPVALAVVVAATVIVVVLVLLGSRAGRPVAEIELVDLTTPAMVLELAHGLGAPFVIELPAKHPLERHDLRLADTTDVEVMAEVQQLDPRYRAEVRGEVLVYHPGPELTPNSVYETRIESFSGEGGAATVVRDLVLAAGLGTRLAIQSDPSGRMRPVKLELADSTLREALVEVCRQGHLGMRNDPRMIRFSGAPQAR